MFCRYMKKWVSGDHKKIIQIACIFVKNCVVVNELYFYPQNSLTAATSSHTAHTYTSNTLTAQHRPPRITDGKLSTHATKVAQNGFERLLEGHMWVGADPLAMIETIEHQFCITE